MPVAPYDLRAEDCLTSGEVQQLFILYLAQFEKIQVTRGLLNLDNADNCNRCILRTFRQ